MSVEARRGLIQDLDDLLGCVLVGLHEILRMRGS